MGRAPCCDKTKVKKGPWSPEEDATLKKYLESYGTGGNWIALPGKAGLKRCGKSCRLRWLNYLRPDIKHGGFTDEENNIIYTLYSKIGSRWSVIASHLQGRTDNDVKNHWNTKLKKKLIAAPVKTNHSNDQVSAPTPSVSFVQQSDAYSTSLSLDEANYGLNMNTQNLIHPQTHYYPLQEPTQEYSTSVSGFSSVTMDGNYNGELGFSVDFVNGMWDEDTIGEFGYQFQSLGSSVFSDVKPLGLYQSVTNQY